MQQLFSAFGIDWRLLIAQAVNFAIVLVALWYFLYQPVLAMLEKRRQIVAKGVKDAADAAETLRGADTEAMNRIKAAESEATLIMDSARVAAHEEQERLLADAETHAVAVTSDAEVRAREIAARAKRESEQDIARLAILAAEQILKKRYD